MSTKFTVPILKRIIVGVFVVTGLVFHSNLNRTGKIVLEDAIDLSPEGMPSADTDGTDPITSDEAADDWRRKAKSAGRFSNQWIILRSISH